MISNLKKATAVGMAMSALLTGCAQRAERGPERVDVAAAFFPIAEAAQRIGGGRVRVTNLTPAGAEPHDLELSTSALDRVIDADVVFYLGGFQPALDDALDKAEGTVVDLLDGVELHEDEHAEDDGHSRNPHVWLDPVLWSDITLKVEEALIDADAVGKAAYAKRADTYRERLESLNEDFDEGLAKCERDLVVTSHAAFGYLTERYGLGQEAISGISPEAEPDPQRLAELADLVRDKDVTTIFTEVLVSPDVARSLAREARVRTDVLDPIESEPDGGYLGGMHSNLAALRKALGCT